MTFDRSRDARHRSCTKRIANPRCTAGPRTVVRSLAVAAALLIAMTAGRPAAGGMPSEGRVDAVPTAIPPPAAEPAAESRNIVVTEEQLTLPASREIAGGTVRLHADSARVVIRWDAVSTTPYLDARWSVDTTDRTLSMSSNGSETGLRFVHDSSIEGYPVIELHLAPGQGAAVFGSLLSVDALNPGGDGPEPGPPAQLEVDAGSSELIVTDIEVLSLTGRDVVLYARGGPGTWTLDLGGGSAELVDHRGALQVTGRHTDLGLDAIEGTVKLELEDSTASLRGGRANITATATGATIDCDEIGGSFTFSGSSTSVSLRRTATSSLSLSGDDLYLSLEGGAGRAVATLTGGELLATSWSTRIDLRAREGTSATIRDLDGDFAFEAAAGAAVDVSGVTGHVRGRSNESVFRGSSLKSIELEAQGSDVTITETLNLTSLVLTNTIASLNLDRLRGERAISLQGDSRADIELRSPCQVRVEGPGAANIGRVSVRGCDTIRPGQPWTRQRLNRQVVTATDSIRLSVSLDSQASVSVSGY